MMIKGQRLDQVDHFLQVEKHCIKRQVELCFRFSVKSTIQKLFGALPGVLKNVYKVNQA